MKESAEDAHVLYVFENDLRLDDNSAFNQACEFSKQNRTGLMCLYCFQTWYLNFVGLPDAIIGRARFEFLRQSLSDLRRNLAARGLSLTIRIGSISEVIPELHSRHSFDAIFYSQTSGFYENKHWLKLSSQLTTVKFEQVNTNTLFQPHDLPFQVSELPKHFTPFRKKVEELVIEPPVSSGQDILNGFTDDSDQWQHISSIFVNKVENSSFEGGAQAGQLHLIDYFESKSPSTYKTTRNQLLGWYTTTKFSPWLALGCISPRQIMHHLKAYEKKYGANESTYWIYFELLWREFFYWNAIKQEAALFQAKNTVDVTLSHGYQTDAFKSWSTGKTGVPLIDACMRELNHTGYLSNRGRQIAASFLINELGVEWRLGAKYFECMLIDYDVASNWGNWQYIAGVGADPRGGRHFNIEKQQRDHDPEQKYIKKWSEIETNDVHVFLSELID